MSEQQADGAAEKSSGFWGFFRRILQIDDTHESVARGVALGVFVGLTPTVGVQMLIVAILNTLCRANRLAGLLMVYISNPLTMIPIYWCDYQVGRFILGQPSISKERFEKIFALEGPNIVAKTQSFVSNLAEFSWDVAGPLFLGGFILGALFALPSYPLTLALLKKYKGSETEPKSAEAAAVLEGSSGVEE